MKKQYKDSFINVGLDRIIHSKNIIGVFDIDSITVRKDSREFLNRAQREGEIEDISTDLPISFILCDGEEKKQHIIFTSFSLPTLHTRMKRKFP